MNSDQFLQLEPMFARYNTIANWTAIAARAEIYGAQTTTAFRRAFKELVDSHAIKPNPAYFPPPERVSEQFRTEVATMSSGDLLRRLRDPEFKHQFDLLAQEDANGSIRTVTAPTDGANEYADFQAKDWHALPPDTLARLMSKPSFRKRVDELVAAGSI
jgi:hypothetical protein